MNKIATRIEMKRNTQARIIRKSLTRNPSVGLVDLGPGGAIERCGLKGFVGAGCSL
jgi:hypothetical protein